jgi:hypothetical protein
MGRACSTKGGKGMHIAYWWESQKKRDHYADQDVGGWIVLNWILERKDWVVLTGLIWLKIGTSGGFL